MKPMKTATTTRTTTRRSNRFTAEKYRRGSPRAQWPNRRRARSGSAAVARGRRSRYAIVRWICGGVAPGCGDCPRPRGRGSPRSTIVALSIARSGQTAVWSDDPSMTVTAIVPGPLSTCTESSTLHGATPPYQLILTVHVPCPSTDAWSRVGATGWGSCRPGSGTTRAGWPARGRPGSDRPATADSEALPELGVGRENAAARVGPPAPGGDEASCRRLSAVPPRRRRCMQPTTTRTAVAIGSQRTGRAGLHARETAAMPPGVPPACFRVRRPRPACRPGAGGPPPRPRSPAAGQQVAHLVRSGEQHHPGERVDSNGEVLVAGQVDDLGLEVDGELDVRVGSDELEQVAVLVRLDDDRQQAVLQGVVPEDVGERRRRIARIPHAVSAHGACSRDEPAPKLSPTSRICRSSIRGRSMTNSGSLSPPSSS